jgi:hypothetical protein
MNISRHVLFAVNRHQIYGKRSLPQLDLPIRAATTIAATACLSTAVIVFFYTANNKISNNSKAERSSHQNSIRIPLRYMDFCQSNRTRCDSITEDTTPINTQVTVHYSEAYDPDLDTDSSGYSEAERFYQCVTYHRSLLHDYIRRWGDGTIHPSSQVDEAISIKTDHNNPDSNTFNNSIAKNTQYHTDTSSRWPRNVPHPNEVKALECDLVFCERSPEYQKDVRVCQSTKFLIASYYVSQYNNTDRYSQREKGFKVVKELAEQGYPDAMCLYGTLIYCKIF